MFPQYKYESFGAFLPWMVQWWRGTEDGPQALTQSVTHRHLSGFQANGCTGFWQMSALKCVQGIIRCLRSVFVCVVLFYIYQVDLEDQIRQLWRLPNSCVNTLSSIHPSIHVVFHLISSSFNVKMTIKMYFLKFVWITERQPKGYVVFRDWLHGCKLIRGIVSSSLIAELNLWSDPRLSLFSHKKRFVWHSIILSLYASMQSSSLQTNGSWECSPRKVLSSQLKNRNHVTADGLKRIAPLISDASLSLLISIPICVHWKGWCCCPSLGGGERLSLFI